MMILDNGLLFWATLYTRSKSMIEETIHLTRVCELKEYF